MKNNTDMEKQILKIVTPMDLTLIRCRIGEGMTSKEEALAVCEFLEQLTFRTVFHMGKERKQCRICGCWREFGHSDLCSAKAVL